MDMNKFFTLAMVVAVSLSGMAQSADYKTREEVPVEFTWNFADLYPSWEAWQADFDKVESMIPELAARGLLLMNQFYNIDANIFYRKKEY